MAVLATLAGAHGFARNVAMKASSIGPGVCFRVWLQPVRFNSVRAARSGEKDLVVRVKNQLPILEQPEAIAFHPGEAGLSNLIDKFGVGPAFYSCSDLLGLLKHLLNLGEPTAYLSDEFVYVRVWWKTDFVFADRQVNPVARCVCHYTGGGALIWYTRIPLANKVSKLSGMIGKASHKRGQLDPAGRHGPAALRMH
jgi:hypothetical protein